MIPQSKRSRYGGKGESHGEWIYVQSSNVRCIAYDEEGQSLYVAFKNGGMYEYLNVPPFMYAEFLRAPSKGKYLYWRIKDKFQYLRHA